MRDRFWERFSLAELSATEWEALCDGCGQCCLVRRIKNNTVTVYAVACELLDIQSCRCSDYENRLQVMSDCNRLTPTDIPNWLPETCGYRRVRDGRPLPKWHPLVTGSREQMKKKEVMVSHYAVSETDTSRRKMKKVVVAKWSI